MGDLRGGATVSDYLIWHQGNMGSGSGLDADSVDGKHASDFSPSGFGLGTVANRLCSVAGAYDLNNLTTNGWFDGLSPTNGVSCLTWQKILNICSGDTSNITQMAFSMSDTRNQVWIRQKTNGAWGTWVQMTSDNNLSFNVEASDMLEGAALVAEPLTFMGYKRQITQPATGMTEQLVAGYTTNLLRPYNYSFNIRMQVNNIASQTIARATVEKFDGTNWTSIVDVSISGDKFPNNTDMTVLAINFNYLGNSTNNSLRFRVYSSAVASASVSVESFHIRPSQGAIYTLNY